jgi:hypothetical protein
MLEPSVKHQRDTILNNLGKPNGDKRKVFVETGSAQGETTKFSSRYFDRVFTIEYTLDYYLHNLERFSHDDSVTCLKGDSKDILPVVNRDLKEDAVFFLDAHFCGLPGEEEELVAPSGHTPVVNELTDIIKYPYDHAILIDDARLFGKDPHYPTIKEIEEIAAGGDFGGYVTNVEGDIIVITRGPDWVRDQDQGYKISNE